MANTPRAQIHFDQAAPMAVELNGIIDYIEKRCYDTPEDIENPCTPVKALREAFAEKPNNLAKALGLSLEGYAAIENDFVSLTRDQIITLCRHYSHLGTERKGDAFTLPPSILHIGQDYYPADLQILEATRYALKKPITSQQDTTARRHMQTFMLDQLERGLEYAASFYTIPGSILKGSIIDDAALMAMRRLMPDTYGAASDEDETLEAYDDLIHDPAIKLHQADIIDQKSLAVDLYQTVMDALADYKDFIEELHDQTIEEIETTIDDDRGLYTRALKAAERFVGDAHKFKCLKALSQSLKTTSAYVDKNGSHPYLWTTLREYPFLWAEENNIKVKRNAKTKKAAQDLVSACMTYIGAQRILASYKKSFKTTQSILEQYDEWENGSQHDDCDSAHGIATFLDDIAAFIVNYEALGGELYYNDIKQQYTLECEMDKHETPSKTEYAAPGKMAGYIGHRRDGGTAPDPS